MWDPSEDTYFVMRDTNLDGAFESAGPMKAPDFYKAYPAPWDNKYVEP